MHLKSLTLKGFKSFADKTVLHFEPDLAAIVGPNGSGKSNISDAVLWVLGERNAKNLRGQLMEDVIFAGSSARKAVSVAEVELCLDNSDNTLPVDYTEVSIGRRMYRNGESEYLINGSVVRRMDVLDVLHDSGLGTGTNSIISQGNLDSILSSKPEDRRALIEEAAGVLKHKERKAKSERKLARMDTSLNRLNDILREVERQLGPLKRKASKVMLYEELSEELASVTLDLSVDNLARLQEEWNKVERLEAESAELLKTQEERIAGIQAQLDALQEQQSLRNDVEGALYEKQRRVNAVSQRLDSIDLLLREKLKRAQADSVGMGRAQAEAEEALRTSQEELERAKEAFERISASREELKARLNGMEVDYDMRRTQQRDLRRQIETVTSQQRTLTHNLETLQATKQALAKDLSEKRALKAVIDQALAAAQEEHAAQNEACELVRQQAEEAHRAYEKALEQEKAAREQLNQQTVIYNECRDALDVARQTQARLQAECSALEEVERSEECANALSAYLHDLRHETGSPAPLTHLIQVEPGWEPAVEAALAQKLGAYVVRSDEELEEVFAQLVDKGLKGNAFFLIEDALSETSKSDPCPNQEALTTKVTAPAEHQALVGALLAGVYCADSLQQARQLSQKNPAAFFVTQDGQLFCAEYARYALLDEADRERSTISRRRHVSELRQKVEEATKAHDACLCAFEAEEEKLRACQSAALRLSEQVVQARGLDANASEKVKDAQAQLELLVQRVEQYRSQQEENDAYLDKADPEDATLDARIMEIQARLEQEKEALSQLENTLSPLQQTLVADSQKISDLRLELVRLDERVAYEERLVANHSRDVEQAKSARQQAVARLRAAELIDMRSRPLMESLGLLSETVRKTLIGLEEQASSHHDEQRQASQHVMELTAQQRALRQEHDEATAAHTEFRVEKGRLEVQVNSAIEVITQDCGVSLETALQRERLTDREAAQEKCDQLTRRIKHLGAISPDAAREYEEVQQRHAYLFDQLQDIASARASLERIVAMIDQRIKDDFVTTFELVNLNFQEIFSTLFPGGSAYLSLDDPDDPEHSGVEVNAHPLGKRVKKMSLLSGGEKSMTALALLFAVYRIRKTPFYILDEVEAALDDTNLRRLLAYLDTIRSSTQFILITHQRRTMEKAAILYGVSMQADGVTKVLSQRLEDALASADRGK